MKITVWEIFQSIDWVRNSLRNKDAKDLIDKTKVKIYLVIAEKENKLVTISEDWIHINKKGILSIDSLITINEILQWEFYQLSIINKFESLLLWDDKIFFNLLKEQYLSEIDFNSKPEKMKAILSLTKVLSVENSPLYKLCERLMKWEEIIWAMIKVLSEYNIKLDESNNFLPKKVKKFLIWFNNSVSHTLEQSWYIKPTIN